MFLSVPAQELLSYPDTKQALFYKPGKKTKTWKPRLFILFMNVFYYYKSEKDLKPRGAIPVGQATIMKADKDTKRPSLSISIKGRQYLISPCSDQQLSDKDELAKGRAIMEEWKQLLNAIEDCKTNVTEATIIKKGYLKKTNRIGMKQTRLFLLTNRCMFYYEKENDEAPKGGIILDHAVCSPEGSSELGFSVRLGERVFNIIASNANEKQEWIAAIQQVIDSLWNKTTDKRESSASSTSTSSPSVAASTNTKSADDGYFLDYSTRKKK